MSKAQKDAVIQMHKASKKKKDEKKSRQASSISKDNIILLGKAIVAGVAWAQKSELSDTDDTQTKTSISTKSTKQTAPSGGVGNFLSKRKKSKNDWQSMVELVIDVIYNLNTWFCDYLAILIMMINNTTSLSPVPTNISSLRVVMLSQRKRSKASLSSQELEDGCRLGLDSHASP